MVLLFYFIAEQMQNQLYCQEAYNYEYDFYSTADTISINETKKTRQINYQFPQINWYNSIKKPKVVSTISVNSWFEKIKDSSYKETILNARAGIIDYNQTKASLPCITYNFLFQGYKKDENILESSGLIYIDIDNENFDINRLDLSKVFACYRSFGGIGYSIIVQVKDLTLFNFKSTYSSITLELGIGDFVDLQAIKASQFNVLSYDPNLFLNLDSHVFASTNLAPQSSVIEEKEKKAYTTEWGAKSSSSIRFNNLDTIDVAGEYIVNWEGYTYIKCFIPMKKVSTNRNNFLLSFCNNLVYLNPQLSEEKAFCVLDNVNRFACVITADDNQIKRVVSSIFKYKLDGSLKPIYFNKQRKIVFDQKSKLTKEEKLEICRSEVALKKGIDSRQKLYEILETWNFLEYGRITQRKVYQNFPMSKKTVEKYWIEFKDYVELLNKNFSDEV